MSAADFNPSWWLPGSHAHTLWPTLTRQVRLDLVPEQVPTPDGDLIHLDWVGESGPVVVVLPGLQGDIQSPYVRRVLRACQRRGWRGVLLNYRGCRQPNRLAQSYHCGMTSDVDQVVHLIRTREPGTPICVVGYSLGANICLKWLGEAGACQQELPVAAAVCVSAPFHLGKVAQKIERGFSRLYQWRLLNSLRRDVRRKIQAVQPVLQLRLEELRHLTTFRRFDERISAPLHGFNGAEDYYEKTRTDRLLRHIGVPTLILNARDDPFVPSELLPKPADLSEQITLEVTGTGGHLGFVSGKWPWAARSWLEVRVPQFLADFI